MLTLFSLPLPTLALLSSLLHQVSAKQLHDNAAVNSSTVPPTWEFPSRRATSAFNSVDTVKAQWQSNYTSPNLKMWCKLPSAKTFNIEYNINVPTTSSQLVPLSSAAQPGKSLLCHLMLSDLSTTSVTTDNSPSFTVQNNPNAKPQTWSIDSTSPPTTSVLPSDPASTTAEPSTTSSPSATASSTTSPSSGGGLSTAAGVGIGIGVAILAVALAVGGILLFLRARRRKAQRATDAEEDGTAKKRPMIDTRRARAVPGVHETMGNRPYPQEVVGDRSWPSEMEGSSPEEAVGAVVRPAVAGGGVTVEGKGQNEDQLAPVEGWVGEDDPLAPVDGWRPPESGGGSETSSVPSPLTEGVGPTGVEEWVV